MEAGFCSVPVLRLKQGRKSSVNRSRSLPVSCAENTTPMKFWGISHAGMLVEDTQKALKFYTEVLGMIDVSERRPNLAFGGAFVQAGDQEIHLMELPNPDPKTGRPEHGGRDKHLAMGVSNIDPLIERLESHGVDYTMSKSGRRAVFCRDIDSNALEFVEQIRDE